MSPALKTTTVSPRRTSSRAISSALCKLACCTVVPATTTGSNTATGVAAPVRPIDMTMSRTIVVACSAAYLYATAPRGFLPTSPSSSKRIRSLIFITKPSVLNGNFWRFSSHSFTKFITPAISVNTLACLFRVIPSAVSA